MRPAAVIRRSSEYLARHGVESPQQEAEELLMGLLDVTRAQLYARTEGLDTRTARSFGRALCQRCKGTPLQYLTARHHDRNGVRHVRHLGLGLADADRLDHHDIERGGERSGGRPGRRCEPSQPVSGRGRPRSIERRRSGSGH